MSCTDFISATTQYGNANGDPFIGQDYQAQVKNTACDYGVYDFAGNFHIHYSYDDLQADINGLENAVWGDREQELKEIQAHKDLLDHVAFLVSMGEMTEKDVADTQESVHAALKDGHNRYYHFYDLSRFPRKFINEPSTGLVGNNPLCNYLRKKHCVWYVSFQKNRVVAMGSRYLALVDCMNELHNELRLSAEGGGINYDYNSTKRFDRFVERSELELANVDLIADTWGVSVEEAFEILKNSITEEEAQEHALREFALTGKYPIDPLL
jgi:hypothetical protein